MAVSDGNEPAIHRVTARAFAIMRRIDVLLVAGTFLCASAAGAYYSGGGRDLAKGNDCLIGYENVDPGQVTLDGKKHVVSCIDCDPTCDLDGVPTPDGACTIAIGVCLNQSGVEGCAPSSSLDKAIAKGVVKGAATRFKIDVRQQLERSSCGSLLGPVRVPVRRAKAGVMAGKFSLNLLASTRGEAEDATKRTDKDKLIYLCVPRPEGSVCPVSTTTTEPTTSTTFEATTTCTTIVPTTSSTMVATTSTSVSTTLPPPSVLRFITGAPGETCGIVRTGGVSGIDLKALGCGGLNMGGGNSTVAEGPIPDNAETQMNVTCVGPVCTVSGRSAAQTASPTNCSAGGCPFGPYLPVSNAGASTCLRNTFSAPATGTLDRSLGAFVGAFPLTSTFYLTANAALPCPLCVGGTPGVVASGTCQGASQWSSGAGPSPDAGNACTPTNVAGNTHDCDPPAAGALTPLALNISPITTELATRTGPSFCPSQASPGAFACNGTATALCPDGALGVADYIAVNGVAAGQLVLESSAPVTLASVFCIPDAGNFVINAAANLPGPGAASLPGTFELLP